jgi:NlpC/P60 family putative phage cell wall peptidase
MPAREAIVAAALTWLDTPYQHQASVRGAGCDCLGLIRGVWRMTIGPEPEALPPYSPHWAEGTGEYLLQGLARWLTPTARPAPGDVLVFRMGPAAVAKHCAILDGSGEGLIHAYWGRAVVESRFAPWWRRRLAGAFSFPGVV